LNLISGNVVNVDFKFARQDGRYEGARSASNSAYAQQKAMHREHSSGGLGYRYLTVMTPGCGMAKSGQGVLLSNRLVAHIVERSHLAPDTQLPALSRKYGTYSEQGLKRFIEKSSRFLSGCHIQRPLESKHP
jgi:hypothetical protein